MSNHALINNLNARIRGIKASMADMSFTMRADARSQIKSLTEQIEKLEAEIAWDDISF